MAEQQNPQELQTHKRKTKKKKASRKSASVTRPYPRVTLEEAIQLPNALKEKNGGNPWPPEELGAALGISFKTPRFFYIAAASRDFGLTEGSRDSKQISLTQLGRDLVYSPNSEVEKNLKHKAFLNIDLFNRVLEFYKGSDLPEMKYLRNTLEKEFELHPSIHDEFSQIFRENCEYLKIGSGFSTKDTASGSPRIEGKEHPEIITLAEPETETGLHCFVIMPFKERDGRHPEGFFEEVLRSLITPAGRKAGFTVTTANRQGTDVIQATIVNDLLNADLVLADLTENNPNVLFELGMRMAADKPVSLIRAKGTPVIFDIDNMLRVFDYDPNLWVTTVARDLLKLSEHIKATWENREKDKSYMKILRTMPELAQAASSSS